MKKSMSVILLGSALLLSTTNSAEASYRNNDVESNKAMQNVQLYMYEGKFSSYNPEEVNQYVNAYINQIEKYFGNDIEFPIQKPAKPSVPDEKAKPVEPSEPVEQEKPVEPSKPVEQERPVKPSKPVEQEKPVKPSQPVEQEKPVVQEKPDEEKVQNANVSAIEQAVLDLTNAERQKAGLKPLQIDKNLMNSARQKSTDMATNNYFSHTSPTYGSPFDQMKANGISYRAAAENIAMGQRSAEEVVKAWMESPGHRQNILTPNFTHIGIGYDAKGNYWTQQFIQK